MQLFREHGHEHPVLGDGGMCWLPHLDVAEPAPFSSSTWLGDPENGAWRCSRGFSFSSKLSICQMDGARRALMTLLQCAGSTRCLWQWQTLRNSNEQVAGDLTVGLYASSGVDTVFPAIVQQPQTTSPQRPP